MNTFSMILAADSKNGIGKNQSLAWNLKNDMKHFQKISISTNDENKCNAVIMGRKTWESIPKKYRPLPGRINCVLSRNSQIELEGAALYHDFDTCLDDLAKQENIENIFVIGGSYLYNGLLEHRSLKSIFLTHVEGDFTCDVFFEGVPKSFRLKTISSKQKEGDIEYYFAEYIRKDGLLE